MVRTGIRPIVMPFICHNQLKLQHENTLSHVSRNLTRSPFSCMVGLLTRKATHQTCFNNNNCQGPPATYPCQDMIGSLVCYCLKTGLQEGSIGDSYKGERGPDTMETRHKYQPEGPLDFSCHSNGDPDLLEVKWQSMMNNIHEHSTLEPESSYIQYVGEDY